MSSLPFLIVVLAVVAAYAQSVSLRGKLFQSPDDLRFIPPRAPVAHQASREPSALELLNVALLASVDGKFHAVDRRTGQTLWSMTGLAGTNPPSYLGPLVSTQHPDFDPDYDDPPETYIIEPQSGDIYVTSGPSEALQRLPFSMSQFVEMSPFSFGESDKQDRVFVGRKKTSLLVLELQTGRVKAALDSECPWLDNPFEDFEDDGEIDLDELDGTKEPKEYPVEIQIGRSDYLVSIHTLRSSSSAPRVPTHSLSFSTYGPNNQDQQSQLMYQRTPDDTYIEPLPNGEVIAFKIQSPGERTASSAPQTELLWGQQFSSPIVAVFDVVRAPHRRNPFVLLQPRPRLDDTISFFELTSAAKRKTIDASSAYVGLVEETGSLYALSPDHYSLVIFSSASSPKTISAVPSSADEVSTPETLDMEEFCRTAVNDRRCATGLRQLRDDSRSRLARLLDAAPSAALLPAGQPSQSSLPTSSQESVTLQPVGNRTPSRMWPPFIGASPHTLRAGETVNMWGTSGVAALLACTMFALGTLWASRRRSPSAPASPVSSPVPPSPAPPAIQEAPSDSSLPPLELGSGRAEEAASTSSSSSLPTPPSPAVVLSLAPVPSSTKPILLGPTIPLSPSAGESDDHDGGEEENSEREAPGKKKNTRRKRGRRKRGAARDAFAETEGEGGEGEEGAPGGSAPPTPSIIVPQTPVPAVTQSLVLSDTVLGFGSHGTVVYQGSLQGRAVAVKRLLNDFTTLALREVSLLQDADDHPNVIRYYYQESHANFLYIALELCPASLADVIERPHQFPELSAAFVAKRALREIASGLRHLHALKIVHRDIKPQNILVADAKKGHRMLISDFGLCRKLELDQTSFLPTAGGAMGVGTFGWRAPEILRGDVKLDDAPQDDASMSSRGSSSTATSTGGHSSSSRTRLTKSVDIFALGCLFYYCLTSGGHPFGDRFEREVNIIKNVQDLDGLKVFEEEGAEAADLITKMLAPEAADRPDTTTCLMHPYFWNAARRLNFLQDVSDRFENMCRDPRDAHLVALEAGAHDVVGNDWAARLDRIFVDNLGKFRKYDGRSVQDLLRALRNKRHHYQDLPENVKRHVGSMPEGFLAYFTRRYPRLFLHVHRVIADSTLRTESMFRAYFSVPD